MLPNLNSCSPYWTAINSISLYVLPGDSNVALCGQRPVQRGAGVTTSKFWFGSQVPRMIHSLDLSGKRTYTYVSMIWYMYICISIYLYIFLHVHTQNIFEIIWCARLCAHVIATCTCTILDEICIFYTDCNIQYILDMSIFWYDDDIGVATGQISTALVRWFPRQVPFGEKPQDRVADWRLSPVTSGWIKMIWDSTKGL